MLLNNQEITEEIKEEIKNYLETNDNENTVAQNVWDAAKAVLRVDTDTGLPQETRKISNKQPNIPPKRIRKRRISEAQSQQRKGNNRDQRGNK